jgi:hydrogenase maturation protease
VRRVVVGVGNPFRSDDGVGLAVARRLRPLVPEGVDVVELEGEPVELLDAWDGADLALVVDAISTGGEPGTVVRVEAGKQPVPARPGSASTHLLGLAEAIELGRELGRLPRRTVVFGIEGGSFAAGEQLTPEVERAAGEAAEAVLAELESG